MLILQKLLIVKLFYLANNNTVVSLRKFQHHKKLMHRSVLDHVSHKMVKNAKKSITSYPFKKFYGM